MIDIDRLSIVHYCHPHCEPLRNIMRLPRDEAFAFAKSMAVRNENTTAFYRFADFENYFPRRKEADALLHRAFSALGFAPENEHPLSFVLEGSEYLKNWFGNGNEIRVPLDSIPETAVSFTFGDSMGALKRNEPLRLVSKGMLLNELSAYRGNLTEYMREIEASCHYIEAQIWSDECVVPALQNNND